MKIPLVVERILLASALLVALICATLLSVLMPRFQKQYEGFGADLPALTDLAFHFGWIAWLMPALVIVGWLFWPHRNYRSFAALAIGVMGSPLFLGICMIAMQMPIEQMGATVGG